MLVTRSATPAVEWGKVIGWRNNSENKIVPMPLPTTAAHTHEVVCCGVRLPTSAACNTNNIGPV
jgi:hypothetical protein